MMQNKNVVVKKECHSRGFGGPQGSGISRLLRRCRLLYCHPESLLLRISTSLPFSFINNMRGRFQDPVLKHYGAGQKVMPRFGMTSLYNNSAFTLIELLVVVLIVSILTAAALSGYNFAVEKTKYTSLIALGNKIWTYEKYYKLANGQFTNNLSKLEIQLSDPNLVITFFGSADFSGGWDGFDLRYKKPYSPVYRVFLGKNWVGRRACIVDGSVANQKMARKVCDHFAGQTGSQTSYYMTFFKENLK